MTTTPLREMSEFDFDIDFYKISDYHLRMLSENLGGPTDTDLQTSAIIDTIIGKCEDDCVLRDLILDFLELPEDHKCFVIKGAKPRKNSKQKEFKLPSPQPESSPIAKAVAATITAASPAPLSSKVVQAASMDAATSLLAALNAAVRPSINEADIHAMVQKALGNSTMPTKTVVVNGKVSVDMGTDHLHPAFDDLLSLASQRKNMLLVGAAGSGKTHAAHQVAEALKLDFASISVTAGMSTSQITGWMMPKGYVPSDFVRIYENGGVFLFDEIDAADANTLTIVNQALANGSFHIAMREDKPLVKRHADFICVACANTFGNGADLMYAGREQLDAATIDRFHTVVVDYDTTFEKKVATPEILDWAHRVRSGIATLKLRRVMSTRKIIDLSDMHRSGWSVTKCRSVYFASWSKDEVAKINSL